MLQISPKMSPLPKTLVPFYDDSVMMMMMMSVRMWMITTTESSVDTIDQSDWTREKGFVSSQHGVMVRGLSVLEVDEKIKGEVRYSPWVHQLSIPTLLPPD